MICLRGTNEKLFGVANYWTVTGTSTSSGVCDVLSIGRETTYFGFVGGGARGGDSCSTVCAMRDDVFREEKTALST